jgi:S1-C subfamily serine protease
MKKSLKVGMLLSVLLAGGCNNNECNCPNSDDSTVVENIDDKSGHSEEYKETAPSVVMIRVQKKSDTTQIATTGSGVVYDEEGQYAYILTNAHVLERADEYHEVEIVFSNEEGKKTEYGYLS